MKYQHTIADAMRFAEQKSCVVGWKGHVWKRAGDRSIVSGRATGDRFSAATIEVTDAELDAWAAAYEQETGRCYDCKGDRLVVVGWSREHGQRKAPCKRCDESGAAQSNLPAISVAEGL